MSEQHSIQIVTRDPGEVFQHWPCRMVSSSLPSLEQLESRPRTITNTNG